MRSRMGFSDAALTWRTMSSNAPSKTIPASYAVSASSASALCNANRIVLGHRAARERRHEHASYDGFVPDGNT